METCEICSLLFCDVVQISTMNKLSYFNFTRFINIQDRNSNNIFHSDNIMI